MTLFEIVRSLRHAATPRIDSPIWPLTTHVDELGGLCVGGMALTEVADEFGTPTYVIDEADLRHRIRRYRTALPEARFVYAGKALLTTAVAQWVAEEGGGLGVCSVGEFATALVAGVDPCAERRSPTYCPATAPATNRRCGRCASRAAVKRFSTASDLCSVLPVTLNSVWCCPQ